LPDAPGLELILAEINRSHPGAVLDTSFDREQPALIADPGQIVDVLAWLRDTPGQEYTFLSSLHGVDYLPLEPRFAVHYELLSRERNERLRVKAVLPDPAASGAASVAPPDGRLSTESAGAASVSPGVPSGATPEAASGASGGGQDALPTPAEKAPGSATGSVSETTVAASVGGGRDERSEERVSPAIAQDHADPSTNPAGAHPNATEYRGELLPSLGSCVHLYPTAEFQEREVFDFFGIFFEGHPDLRRILMPEDYVGWPQRRDFPVGGEQVLFTKDEIGNPGWWK